MRRHRLHHVFVVGLVALGADAWCTSASELEQMPSSVRCRNEEMNLGPLFDRRDQGMSREQALALVDKSQGVPISRRAVQIAFDFPTMHRDGVSVYIYWACHALEHFVVVRPLAELSAEFDECYGQPLHQRTRCASVLWNKVHGFQPDRKSRAPMTVVREAPRVLTPSPASQADAGR